MAFVEIEGRRVYYEILGNDNGVPIAITPGGRFSMRFPGYRELAEALAPEMKVLIWDRPNCGESDLNFTGDSESAMQADNLAALIRQVGMAPCCDRGRLGGRSCFAAHGAAPSRRGDGVDRMELRRRHRRHPHASPRSTCCRTSTRCRPPAWRGSPS